MIGIIAKALPVFASSKGGFVLWQPENWYASPELPVKLPDYAVPPSIPPSLSKEHVLKALADLDAGIAHPFGAPTGYELVHDDKHYPPKAVVGLATRYLIGRILQPEEFSSGIGPGQAVYVLRNLGFNVVEIAGADESLKGTPWSRSEVDLIVEDYFDMLRTELLGESFSKKQHRKAIQALLTSRSEGSIEFKHANISAVLVGMGLPYIEGYKPRGNYQALLEGGVEAFLQARPGFLAQFYAAPRINPIEQKYPDLGLDLLFEPPPEQILGPDKTSAPWTTRRDRKLDFAKRDADNRHLGRLGEQFSFEVEKLRLLQAGRDDLAKKVEWVADTLGDGLGFDLLSFDEKDESERFIEVKTTGLGKFFPFYVTDNEVRCSEAEPTKYHLYRVFDFSRSPRLYVLPGALSSVCQLTPVQYRATV